MPPDSSSDPAAVCLPPVQFYQHDLQDLSMVPFRMRRGRAGRGLSRPPTSQLAHAPQRLPENAACENRARHQS